MNPVVGVIMGSESDFETMREALRVLDRFGVAYEVQGWSARIARLERMFDYARAAAGARAPYPDRGRGRRGASTGHGFGIDGAAGARRPGWLRARSTAWTVLVSIDADARMPTATFAIELRRARPRRAAVRRARAGADRRAPGRGAGALRRRASRRRDCFERARAAHRRREVEVACVRASASSAGASSASCSPRACSRSTPMSRWRDPDPGAPARTRQANFVAARFDDAIALAELFARTDRVTFESENIPAGPLQPFFAQLSQSIDVLRVAQDRRLEKRFLMRHYTCGAVRRGGGGEHRRRVRALRRPSSRRRSAATTAKVNGRSRRRTICHRWTSCARSATASCSSVACSCARS